MARSLLSPQQLALTGVKPTYGAADVANGSYFANQGNVFLHVKGGGAPSTVTLAVPQKANGVTIDNHAVTVPAGEERMIGFFPGFPFNQSDGSVYVDYSAACTVALIKC